MRRITLVLCLGLLTLACTNSKDAVVSGTITGVESDTILINTIIAPSGAPVIDTVALVGGKFKWDVPSDAIRYGHITKMPSSKKNPDGSIPAISMKSINIVTIPGEGFKIKGSIDNYSISGTDFYTELDEYNTMMLPLNEQLSQLSGELGKLNSEKAPIEDIDAKYSEINALYVDINSMTMQFIKANNDKLVALYLSSRVSATTLGEPDSLFSDVLKSGAYEPIFIGLKDRYESAIALEKAEAAMQPGMPAPEFTLMDDGGKEFTLSSLRGKYVVIDFWGSWCGWCIKGFPDMKEMYSKYSSKLEIVGVACRDSKAKWEEALAQYQLPWINVLNNDEADLSTRYAVKGYPTKCIIDPKGNIVKIVLGEDPAFYTFMDELMKK